MKIIDQVRDELRRVFANPASPLFGSSFALGFVYSLADSFASAPEHKNLEALRGVMRRMLQDEQKHRGLTFLSVGVYCYPTTLRGEVPMSKVLKSLLPSKGGNSVGGKHEENVNLANLKIDTRYQYDPESEPGRV